MDHITLTAHDADIEIHPMGHPDGTDFYIYPSKEMAVVLYADEEMTEEIFAAKPKVIQILIPRSKLTPTEAKTLVKEIEKRQK